MASGVSRAECCLRALVCCAGVVVAATVSHARGVIIPPLPEKNAVQKFQMSTEFIEDRRRALQVGHASCCLRWVFSWVLLGWGHVSAGFGFFAQPSWAQDGSMVTVSSEGV